MSTLSVATIKSQSSSPPTIQNTSGTEVGTFCRAWVNFNGTGTVAIRSSFNVSSITDNGTGDYTVNFTNAMADANYAWAGNAGYSGLHQTMMHRSDIGHTYSTTALRVGCIAQNGSSDVYSDCAVIGISIFR